MRQARGGRSAYAARMTYACRLCAAALALTAMPAMTLGSSTLAVAAAPTAAPVAASRVPLAVLGDSDSHAYQDSLNFPAHSGDRGGAWRPTSWQWTELLARWRGHQLDLGDWGRWGASGWRQRLLTTLGQTPRTPRKLDHGYNFAIGGRGCDSLLGPPERQALHLRDLIESAPQAWAGGLVVVRIGGLDLGNVQWLDAAARDPQAAEVVATLTRCQQALTRTVAMLQRAQPELRMVLVGALNEADDADQWGRWRSGPQMAHIRQALDAFDGHLRMLAEADPARRLFFDNRAWFARNWGGRDAAGQPAYRTLNLPGLSVAPDSGDDPGHVLMQDRHFGTAANALWAQALVQQVSAQWPDMGLAPIGEAELGPLWLSLRNAAPVLAVR